MKKRIIAVLAAVVLALSMMTGCGSTLQYSFVDDSSVQEAESVETGSVEAESRVINPEGSYTTKEDVALYLETYDQLPENFITKKEAKAMGWSGGSLEDYAPGYCIGGDRFGNYEGNLPKNEEYHECDINTLGANSRGAERLVYAGEEGDVTAIYYTADHYNTFEQIYEE